MTVNNGENLASVRAKINSAIETASTVAGDISTLQGDVAAIRADVSVNKDGIADNAADIVTIEADLAARGDVIAKTASQWASDNTVLAANEIGLETDTGRAKYGDGSTAWNSLPYRDTVFAERNAVNAAAAASLPDGVIVTMGGWQYEVDSTATGTASATNDLGVDGLVVFAVPHPSQYGSLTRTTPIDLDTGEALQGVNRRKTYLQNSSSAGAITLLGGTGASKHFGIDIKDMTIQTPDYSIGTGYGIETNNQGYPYFENLEVQGGLKGAVSHTGNVGQMNIACNFSHGKAAQEFFNPDSLRGNTVHRNIGTLNRIAEAGIKNTQGLRGYKSLFGVWEGLGKVNEQTDSGSIQGFLSVGEWFEALSTGKVTVSTAGVVYNTGAVDGRVITEKMEVPIFFNPYFSASSYFVGSFYPKLSSAQLTPAGTYAVMKFENQDTDKQFDFDGVSAGWTKSSFGIESTLPKYGDWSDPDEKFYRQGVFNSIAIANAGGIYYGHGNACKNLLSTPIDNTSYTPLVYWPYSVSRGGTISVTSGQADPYGGTGGVLIQNGTKGSSNIPELAGGGKWASFAIIAKAEAAGDMLHMNLTANGGTGWQKTLRLEMPDTEWRIYHMQQYIPANAGANFRIYIGAEGGGVTVARAACYEGADLRPILNYGQEVTTGFTFNHGNVEVLGAAAPTAGKWYIGDRIRYKSPTAGGKMGAVCVAAGSPGTWKEFAAIDA